MIEGFLPQQMDAAATEAAVREAIAESGATGIKEMGKVMAVLRAKHAATHGHRQGRAVGEGGPRRLIAQVPRGGPLDWRLTAMALPPQFLDELRARTPLHGLIGRKTRLARQRPAMEGLLPLPQREDAQLLRL